MKQCVIIYKEIKGELMKIRCKNCYRVLNPNEEYCTNCGEHSAQMQKAMITGDYGPDVNAKFKTGLGIFVLAGFLVCGILQVIFAVLQNKEVGSYSNLFCEVNSLFYSSIFVLLVTILFFRKDLKKTTFNKPVSTYLIALLIGVLSVVVIILLSKILPFASVFPKYISSYLESKTKVFFDLKYECILKIIVEFLFIYICLELIIKKTLIDMLDDTMLGDKAIYLISVLVSSILEVAWIMSLDVIIPVLLINIVTTGIYMYAGQNVYVNIFVRIILVFASVLILVI